MCRLAAVMKEKSKNNVLQNNNNKILLTLFVKYNIDNNTIKV